MYQQASKVHQATLTEIDQLGLTKEERILTTPQGAHIRTGEQAGGPDLKNFCANNYLGLSAHPRLVEAAKRALDTYGFRLSSGRFICGTQTVHNDLEHAVSPFLATEN